MREPFDPVVYRDELGAQPEFNYGIYKNKKRGTLYKVRKLAWNGNNGMDRWEVCYWRVEDYNRSIIHFRSIPEFLEKFEYFNPLEKREHYVELPDNTEKA